MTGGIPFQVIQPDYNQETLQALQEARDIISGKVKTKAYSTARKLFEELDHEC